METDWVDREDLEQDKLVGQADALVTAYRDEYDADAASAGDGKDKYEQMKALYQAKEAAQIVDLYSEHIDHLIRDHEDMVGFLGNDTAMPEGGADAASQTLSEYVDFVNGLENQDIRKKVENELGRKIIVLKMVLSAENFSARFGSIAGGEFVTNTKK